MVIEKLVSRGHGWKEAHKWFWDVYVADTSGQPSLESGVEYTFRDACDKVDRAYERQIRKYAETSEVSR